IEVQLKHPGVTAKQYPRISGFAPDVLLAIEQIVHFPKTPLEAGGFGGECCFLRVRVHLHGEWKLAEDHPQLGTVDLFELHGWGGQLSARRTLKIAKLLERDRRVRFPTNMNGFCVSRFQS